MHYPLELQLEHYMDTVKSLIWPSNFVAKNIKRVATISILFDQGADSPFFNSMFPEDVWKKEAEQQNY